MLKNTKGIDVSRHQGSIDWTRVKAEDVRFAVIRAGYGNTADQKDEEFEANIRGALKEGIAVGVYWFSYAVNAADAEKEARACHKVIKSWQDRLTLPVFFDFEYASESYNREVTYSRQGRTDIIKAFCEAMKKLGYPVGYYTNKDYIQNRIYKEQLPYDLWLADYTGEPDFPCALQQTGSTGKVLGINGNVDMNTCFLEYGLPETVPTQSDLYALTTENLHLRKGGSVFEASITVMPKESRVQVLQKGKWCQVKFGRYVGWCSASYLQFQAKEGVKTGGKAWILPGAYYANGVKVPSLYAEKLYTVARVQDEKALLKELYSWVELKYLEGY